jgi:hypothetical protein
MMIVAIFGNALSPYMLFWQTSEEAEEGITKNKQLEMRFRRPNISNREIILVKFDVGGYGICSICYVINYGNNCRQSSCK